MSQQIQDIWKRFDDLGAKASNDDVRLVIEAIKLQSELLNLRLGGLAPSIAAAIGRSGNG